MNESSARPDYDFDIAAIAHMTDRTANPDWKLTEVSYPNLDVLAFCRSGEAIYDIGGIRHRIQAGDLLLLPKGLVRSAYANPESPWSFCSVSFELRFLNNDTSRLFDSFETVIRSPRLYRMPALFAELLQVWTGKRSGYTVKCKSVIMDILYALIKERDRANYGTAHYSAIERTADLLMENYKQHYSIEELAAHAGLSPSHYRLLFKKITGMTAVQYQNHVRISIAKDLIASGECNVTEAALAVGYQDIYYFSRLFKKLVRESPSRYAKG
ncbi:AraC family transcriptional regulator [Cohnella hashimotonis]|uniref:AraC family transcriptional regulator n=1 Tax=Cohnella hashimotonis TaxID=2826895 RepID=A0ABT6TLR2_9BACL|nr:AraC family transcriptional regulator [Cohnella hashimotonis]